MKAECKTNGTAGLCELRERTDVNSDLHSAVKPLHREKKRQTFSDLSRTENNQEENNSYKVKAIGVREKAMETGVCVCVYRYVNEEIHLAHSYTKYRDTFSVCVKLG